MSHWAKHYLKFRENFPEAYIMDPEMICAAWDMVGQCRLTLSNPFEPA